MRLTRYTDYALRMLMFLGIAEGQPRAIHTIAEAYGISANHLTKVAHQLGQMGYIAATRGRNGGLRLALPPGAIRLGAVIRHTEEDLSLVACFDDAGACRISASCVLRSALAEALAAFFSVLDRYSLEDLLQPGAGLATQLGLPPPTPSGPPLPA